MLAVALGFALAFRGRFRLESQTEARRAEIRFVIALNRANVFSSNDDYLFFRQRSFKGDAINEGCVCFVEIVLCVCFCPTTNRARFVV